MFYISDIFATAPKTFSTKLQEEVYKILDYLKIPFERVDTDTAISMEDCVLINKKLDMNMVKTLFLCNKKKTLFYLFITTGDKKFDTKKFSKELNVSRVSFASEELFESMLGTKIGAATIFSTIIDCNRTIQIIFDKEVLENDCYGCSDGTNTGYMKIKTEYILNILLPYTKHKYKVIEI
ncbi:hypothetical protein C4R89_08890 [Clostridioides difficile]|nr:hypothetical protein [Clostridioides difficile]